VPNTAPDATTERIRPARPGEAAALTALAVRSAASWNDPTDPGDTEELQISEETLARERHYVLVDADDTPLGVYSLHGDGPELILSHLFLEPHVMRTGRGKRLWLHMLETARAAGAERIIWGSDPNAAPFYRAMGAIHTGEERDVFPGWHLQLFRYDL
jgi:GNAT superfamily N-acetyltransferase